MASLGQANPGTPIGDPTHELPATPEANCAPSLPALQENLSGTMEFVKWMAADHSPVREFSGSDLLLSMLLQEDPDFRHLQRDHIERVKTSYLHATSVQRAALVEYVKADTTRCRRENYQEMFASIPELKPAMLVCCLRNQIGLNSNIVLDGTLAILFRKGKRQLTGTDYAVIAEDRSVAETYGWMDKFDRMLGYARLCSDHDRLQIALAEAERSAKLLAQACPVDLSRTLALLHKRAQTASVNDAGNDIVLTAEEFQSIAQTRSAVAAYGRTEAFDKMIAGFYSRNVVRSVAELIPDDQIASMLASRALRAYTPDLAQAVSARQLGPEVTSIITDLIESRGMSPGFLSCLARSYGSCPRARELVLNHFMQLSLEDVDAIVMEASVDRELVTKLVDKLCRCFYEAQEERQPVWENLKQATAKLTAVLSKDPSALETTHLRHLLPFIYAERGYDLAQDLLAQSTHPEASHALRCAGFGIRHNFERWLPRFMRVEVSDEVKIHALDSLIQYGSKADYLFAARKLAELLSDPSLSSEHQAQIISVVSPRIVKYLCDVDDQIGSPYPPTVTLLALEQSYPALLADPKIAASIMKWLSNAAAKPSIGINAKAAKLYETIAEILATYGEVSYLGEVGKVSLSAERAAKKSTGTG
jgi:hypothetical protein